MCYYVNIYGACVSATGYFATRFLNWPLIKLVRLRVSQLTRPYHTRADAMYSNVLQYVYGLTFQLVASLLILIFQAIMNLFIEIVWNNAYGFSYLVSIAGIAHVVGGLWMISAMSVRSFCRSKLNQAV